MPSPEINNVWGNTTPTNLPEVVTLPSGQVVKAKRIGVEMLVLAGILGEGDALTAMIQKQYFGGGGLNADKATQALMNDPHAFGSLMEVMDRTMPLVVVEPRVLLHLEDLEKPGPGGAKTRLIPPDEREPGAIYTDQVPIADKVKLLEFGIGGGNSLTRFHQQPEDSVAAVAAVSGVQDGTQRPAGNRRQRRAAARGASQVRG